MLCKLQEVLRLRRSLNQKQEAGWRKGKKHIGTREDLLQKPHQERELGVSEQLEHQVGECRRVIHSVVVGKKPGPDQTGPSWGKGGSPLIESMGNQREEHVHTVGALTGVSTLCVRY